MSFIERGKRMIEIYNKNSLIALKPFPNNYFDTMITDPPYALNFMGKNWDRCIPGVHFWKMFLRVCKPGAIALVFGGTRTFHRLTCAIEDAGWEIRDCIMWLYGSGFPKSHDISKAIDKTKGAEREVVGDKSLGVDGGKRNPNIHLPHKETQHIGEWGFETSGYAQPITTPATSLAQLWDGWGRP